MPDKQVNVKNMDILGLKRKCTNCEKRKIVNAFWADSGVKLCKECSHIPDLAFMLSVRTP